MELPKIPVIKYNCTPGKYYQIPKITLEQEKEIIDNLKFRANFEFFYKEQKNYTPQNDPFQERNYDRISRLIEDNRN
jgi:hypothetical protein